MSIKIENTENKNELKIEFKVDSAKFDEAINKVFVKNVKYFNIPGFRKGKAPQKIVEKHYGTEIFYEDAFNEVLKEVYEKELVENEVKAVSPPNIEVVQIGKGQDLIFTAIVQIKPEVTLGKYKGIQIKKIEYNVSDEDVEHELQHMADRNSRIVNVEDRAVEDGDITIIDFEGFIDGVAFEGGKAENHELTVGSKTFIPGFEEQLIGMKIDEQKDIQVKFPDDYFSEELKGKEAIFKVKLHEIKKKELPTIDDEFAKDVSEFDTLEELKNSIKEKIQKENTARIKYETEEQAIKTVCESVEIDIPSGMIETEIDNMVKEIENRLKYQGMMLDNYLQMIGKTNEEFRKEYEDQATKSVKSRLVLEAIIKQEDIKVTEQEIEVKLKEMAKSYGKKEEELIENQALKNYIEESLKTEKAIEFIIEKAKITN